MIGYVEGTISHAFADSCFVNVGGVGYRVFISA
ncbi:MAG: Holliday junction branch migration protein RuvA, partial [Selenomonadales bacterium]|nr:Holliday junction branch migration protein RuvA [Selenomonadales bacterium]